MDEERKYVKGSNSYDASNPVTCLYDTAMEAVYYGVTKYPGVTAQEGLDRTRAWLGMAGPETAPHPYSFQIVMKSDQEGRTWDAHKFTYEMGILSAYAE